MLVYGIASVIYFFLQRCHLNNPDRLYMPRKLRCFGVVLTDSLTDSVVVEMRQQRRAETVLTLHRFLPSRERQSFTL